MMYSWTADVDVESDCAAETGLDGYGDKERGIVDDFSLKFCGVSTGGIFPSLNAAGFWYFPCASQGSYTQTPGRSFAAMHPSSENCPMSFTNSGW